MEHAGDNYTNYNWCVWNSNWKIAKGTRGLGSRRTSGDHPNDSVVDNGQNTKKSPGDLGRLAVTRTPVKNHRLTPMWKAYNEWIIIMRLAVTQTPVKDHQLTLMWKTLKLSLFNGVSTFVGYLMPKLFSLKNSSHTIYPIAGRLRGFIPFPRVFGRKWT